MLSLCVKNLSLRFQKQKVFDNFNLTVTAGSLSLIKGKNGTGKTCLLQSICSVIPKHFPADLSGNITFSKDDICICLNDEIHPQYFAYLMQEPDKQLCFPYIEEELFFAAENLERDLSEVKQDYDLLINFFPILKRTEIETTALSFGQKKILLFSAMFLKNPDIFLLDEPGAGLSKDYRDSFMELIKVLKDRKKIIIIAEHDELFDEIAENIVFL